MDNRFVMFVVRRVRDADQASVYSSTARTKCLHSTIEGAPRPLRLAGYGMGAVGHACSVDLEDEIQVEMARSDGFLAEPSEGGDDPVLAEDAHPGVEVGDSASVILARPAAWYVVTR